MKVELLLDGETPSPRLGLVEVRVEEGINRLTRLEMLVACRRQDLKAGQFLGHKLTLKLTEAGETSRFDAVVTAMSRISNPWGGEEPYAYRLRASSAVVLLEQSLRSRVFSNVAAPQLLRQVLQKAGFQNGQDFDLKLLQEGNYPRREQVVQYQESDLAFLRRLMAAEGMNFYFAGKNSGSAEMMMVVDDSAFFPKPFSQGIPYIASRGLVSDKPHVSRFSFGERYLPGKVEMIAHDPASPHTTHQAQAKIKDGGKGSWDLYLGSAGEEEVKHHSRVAGQALEAARHWGEGGSNFFRLRAANVFALRHDPINAAGTKYLAVYVEHRLRQEMQYALGDSQWEMEYQNRFQVVSAQAQLRPSRLGSLLREER